MRAGAELDSVVYLQSPVVPDMELLFIQPSIHSFIHSFRQQVVLEYLLWARPMHKPNPGLTEP